MTTIPTQKPEKVLTPEQRRVAIIKALQQMIATVKRRGVRVDCFEVHQNCAIAERRIDARGALIHVRSGLADFSVSVGYFDPKLVEPSRKTKVRAGR